MKSSGNAAGGAVNGLPPYSVLMSVYAKDHPAWFEEAVRSMAAQSWPPQEILIVQDGPVGEELRAAQKRCTELYPAQIRLIELPQNVGLGEAMRQGVLECRNEWIARMDADDVSMPQRCEEELRAALREQADIVGCDCMEFVNGDENAPAARRVFPQTHDELVRFSRRRSPFCHPAVMMKKSVVLRAGNYRLVYLHEDYDLFVRILASGARGYTVKLPLHQMRVSPDFYRRRGGWRYMSAMLGFNVSMLRSGWMKPVDFVMRSCGNIVMSMAPVGLRSWMYRRFLRK